MSNNTGNKTGAVRFFSAARKPLRFDELHPGSLFRIVSEPSRRIWKSTDQRVYRKAKDYEGFYATVETDKTVAACLRPNDLVMPLRQERA